MMTRCVHFKSLCPPSCHSEPARIGGPCEESAFGVFVGRCLFTPTKEGLRPSRLPSRVCLLECGAFFASRMRLRGGLTPLCVAQASACVFLPVIPPALSAVEGNPAALGPCEESAFAVFVGAGFTPPARLTESRALLARWSRRIQIFQSLLYACSAIAAVCAIIWTGVQLSAPAISVGKLRPAAFSIFFFS